MNVREMDERDEMMGVLMHVEREERVTNKEVMTNRRMSLVSVDMAYDGCAGEKYPIKEHTADAATEQASSPVTIGCAV